MKNASNEMSLFDLVSLPIGISSAVKLNSDTTLTQRINRQSHLEIDCDIFGFFNNLYGLSHLKDNIFYDLLKDIFNIDKRASKLEHFFNITEVLF